METLLISPLDTLFFRDGRPFTMGDDNFAGSIFPPMPSTLYGSLRASYFGNNMTELKNADQKSDLSSKLRIAGYLLMFNDEPVFPLPLDMYVSKGYTQAYWCTLKSTSEFFSGSETSHVLISDQMGKTENVQHLFYLTKRELHNYFNNAHTTSVDVLRLKDYTTREVKVGMGRVSATHAAKEGRLYKINQVRCFAWDERRRRMNTLCFMIQYENLPLKTKGLLKLGGEGKMAGFENGIAFPNINITAFEGDLVKLYFATPAIFDEGNYPKKFFADNKIKLLAAATGRSIQVGGFSMRAQVKGSLKQSYKAIPAGSVFYISLEDVSSDLRTRLLELNGNSIYKLLDVSPAFHKFQSEGFGIVYCATVRNYQ